MDCYGCKCIKKTGNDKEFCGKTVSKNNTYTVLGCDTSCSECSTCDYDEYHYMNKNNKINTRPTTSLSKNDFLRFLKKFKNPFYDL